MRKPYESNSYYKDGWTGFSIISYTWENDKKNQVSEEYDFDTFSEAQSYIESKMNENHNHLVFNITHIDEIQIRSFHKKPEAVNE